MLPCHYRPMPILSGSSGHVTALPVSVLPSQASSTLKPLLVSLPALGRPILWRMLRLRHLWSRSEACCVRRWEQLASLHMRGRALFPLRAFC
jgi:hypothetical protein